MLVERLLMPLGQLYLFESAYSHEAYRRKVGVPSALAAVVHNGIRHDEFEPVALAADARDVVYLGELRMLKGVDVLIAAIAHGERSGRKVTANFVGDGPDRAALEAEVERAGLRDRVTFRGTLPAREALALGRIVVLPSRADRCPMSCWRPLLQANRWWQQMSAASPKSSGRTRIAWWLLAMFRRWRKAFWLRSIDRLRRSRRRIGYAPASQPNSLSRRWAMLSSIPISRPARSPATTRARRARIHAPAF